MKLNVQWHFAARGGIHSQGFNYSGSISWSFVAWNEYSSTANVGTLNSNELGLYDMSGNVNEWCDDVFADYPIGIVTDPLVLAGGPLRQRLIRGGAYSGHFNNLLISRRIPSREWTRHSTIGFRVVRL